MIGEHHNFIEDYCKCGHNKVFHKSPTGNYDGPCSGSLPVKGSKTEFTQCSCDKYVKKYLAKEGPPTKVNASELVMNTYPHTCEGVGLPCAACEITKLQYRNYKIKTAISKMATEEFGEYMLKMSPRCPRWQALIRANPDWKSIGSLAASYVKVKAIEEPRDNN